MSQTGSSDLSAGAAKSRRRVTTPALFAIGLALLVPLFFVDWFEIKKRLPSSVFLEAELTFLNVVEVTYGATIVVTALAIPVLVCRLLLARRHGKPRVPFARELMGCVSVLVALVAAEATSAIFQARAARQAVMHVGGEQTDQSRNPRGTCSCRKPCLAHGFPRPARRPRY